MMQAIGLAVTFIVSIVLLTLAVIYTVGRWRLNRDRAAAKLVLPHQGEIWNQDGKALFIKNTAKHGVLLAVEINGKLETWWDSWEEWRERLRVRVVVKTPQTFSK